MCFDGKQVDVVIPCFVEIEVAPVLDSDFIAAADLDPPRVTIIAIVWRFLGTGSAGYRGGKYRHAGESAPPPCPVFRDSHQQVVDRLWMDQRQSNYQDFPKHRVLADKFSVNSILRVRCDIIVGNRPETFRNFQFTVIKWSWVADMGG